MTYPTNQQPPRKPMGTFGAVFWGVLLANTKRPPARMRSHAGPAATEREERYA